VLERHLQDWRPDPVTGTDPMPVQPARALAAVLETGDELAAGAELPALWQWIYFQEWAAHSELGSDGHPRAGRFLPPIPDRRRMFAGGRFRAEAPLLLGRECTRTSSVDNAVVKQGRSGEMVLVTVRHEYHQDGALRLVEEQDYAYRSGETAAKDPAAHHVEPAASDAPWQHSFTADPVLLFRYSALTANSHRIHYDAPYCREVERYPGLVVHGPLLVTLLCELVRRRSGARVSAVDYRLRRPVFAGDPVLLTATPSGSGAQAAVRTGTDTAHATAEITLA